MPAKRLSGTPSASVLKPVGDLKRTVPGSKSPVPSSPQSKPKRLKLDEGASTSVQLHSLTTSDRSERLCNAYTVTAATKLAEYDEALAEMFFLENGGNMMDFASWRKKPTQQFLAFAGNRRIESDEDVESSTVSCDVRIPPYGGTPIATATELPPAVNLLAQSGKKISNNHFI
jgi:E1A-binding protein p400, N-terminal